MVAGLTVWPDLGPVEGNVLVVINSTAGEVGEVDAVFDTLRPRVAATAVHVIAPRGWCDYARVRGVPDERILAAVHGAGDVELNHFLQTSRVVALASATPFQLIMGTKAHSLHNDEVKDVFEQRVCLLLGDGLFLAHTLPSPYVYLFDLPGMLARVSRGPKVDAYGRVCRALVDDCHRRWLELGRPAVSDDHGGEESALLAKHLGSAVLAYDEVGPVPLPHVETASSLAGLVRALGDVVADRVHALEERAHAVEVREQLLAEADRRYAELSAKWESRWLARLSRALHGLGIRR